jgi:hypothetical protein
MLEVWEQRHFKITPQDIAEYTSTVLAEFLGNSSLGFRYKEPIQDQ